MKLTLTILMFCLAGAAASTYSQNTRLDIKMENGNMIELVKQIEAKSEFMFYYQKDELSELDDLTVEAQNATVMEILDKATKGTGFDYTVIDRYIVVRKVGDDFGNNFLATAKENVAAQQRSVSGKVTDSNNQPLPGVTVVVEGTTQGTVTNADGHYTLTSIPEDAILVFSFVGMQTQEVVVGNQTVINMRMEEETIGLEEVVAVGYGTQRKLTITGAVSSVESEELETMSDANIESRLQGRVAGVTVINDNSPGGTPTIQIRGVGSINNNTPLYVVDGSPVVGGLDNINPNNIESISILKDASSSAIYGSRAANGVVVVTTKTGSERIEPEFTFSARYGMQNFSNKKIEKLTPMEQAELTWLRYKNDGLEVGDIQWGNDTYGYGPEPVLPDYLTPNGGEMEDEVDFSKYSYEDPYYGIAEFQKEGVDYLDLIRNPNAPIQEYNFGVNGGNEKANYNFSAGYYDQEGTVIHTGYKRYSMRLNSNAKIGKWLNIGENIGISYSHRNSIGTQSDLAPVAIAIRANPAQPPYDIEGNFYGSYGGAPLSELIRNKDDFSNNLRILANTYAQFNFTEELNLKTQLGVELRNSRSRDRNLIRQESGDRAAQHQLSKSYSQMLQTNWSNTLNYNKRIGEHQITGLLGTETVIYDNDWLNGNRSGYPFTDYDYMVLDAGEVEQSSSGAFDEWSLLSYFARLNYIFKDKYLFEGVIRRDGSSRFTETNRWGMFPAASVGWILSEESFMNSVGWINTLKVRLGVGQNGNDNVGNYNPYSTYRSSIYESYYNISGANSTSSQAGFHKYKLGNPDAKWETTTTYNIGIDFAMLDNRLNFNIDLYNRRTTDMLYPDSKPSTFGYLSLASINVGEMLNEGVDVNVTYRGRIGNDFTYNLSGNLSHYKNEIVKLNLNENEIRYGAVKREQVYTASKAGHPISSFYGYVVEGIFNTWEEVEAWPKYNPDQEGTDNYSKPGMFKFKDVNEDGKIDADDRTFYGHPHPDLTYGLNLDLQYKNWNFSMFTQGTIGNELLNYRFWSRFSGTSEKRLLYESWTEERYQNGEKITVPIITRDGNDELHQPSSYFAEDGSYFRIKNIQLGYTIDSRTIPQLKKESIYLYVQATNILTITDYPGLDPEIIPTNNLTLGLDDSVYPTQSNIMFGVNMKF